MSGQCWILEIREGVEASGEICAQLFVDSMVKFLRADGVSRTQIVVGFGKTFLRRRNDDLYRFRSHAGIHPDKIGLLGQSSFRFASIAVTNTES